MDLKNYRGPFFLWTDWESLWQQAKPAPPGAGLSQSPAQTEWPGEALLLLLIGDTCFWQGIQRLVGRTSKKNPPTASKFKPHTLYKNLLKTDHRLWNIAINFQGKNSRPSGSRDRWKALRLNISRMIHKKITNEFYLIKIKNVLFVNASVQRMKRQATD